MQERKALKAMPPLSRQALLNARGYLGRNGRQEQRLLRVPASQVEEDDVGGDDGVGGVRGWGGGWGPKGREVEG